MHICGIICEYNPFHRGHEKQLRQVRQALGADAAVVCLMSGSFVAKGFGNLRPARRTGDF